MKILFDPHVHTIASGHHTTDTITDIAKKARELGLDAVGITDHSFFMPNGAKPSYFKSLALAEKSKCGVEILYGAETNVIDYDGNIDLGLDVLKGLSFTIASLHKDCIKPKDKETHTKCLLSAMENKYINIIGHMDNPHYPVDFSRLVIKAKQTGTLIELNSASIEPNGYRGDATETDREFLSLAKKHSLYIVLSSDSHGKGHIADFTRSLKLVDEVGFPRSLIVNYDLDLFKNIVNKKRNG